MPTDTNPLQRYHSNISVLFHKNVIVNFPLLWRKTLLPAINRHERKYNLFRYSSASFIAAIVFFLLCSLEQSVAAEELLRNNTFATGLDTWRKPSSLASWMPVSAGVVDLDPAADFRGDLLWQPLNVENPADETFTFQVEMARVEADVGAAISFLIEFTDDTGMVHRLPLMSVSNSQLPLAGEGWLTLQRQWVCPPEATRLTKFIIARSAPGHLQLRNPSLTHDSLLNGALPTITGSTPASAAYGTEITLTGSNFGTLSGKVFVNKVSEEWYDSTALTVHSWQDDTIVIWISYDVSEGGEFIVRTAEQVENAENIGFTLTDSSFNLQTTTTPQTVIQGEPLTVTFSLTTSAQFTTDAYGIFFVFDGNSCGYNSNCTVSPAEVIPGAGQTVPISLSIDTTNMPPGHYVDYLQTIESSSYARFAKFEFDVLAKGESPIARAMTEFQGDPLQEGGMGLPRYRINLATLDPVLESCLFRMKTQGPPIRLDLWYLGPGTDANGLFGKEWRLNYESAIRHDANSADLVTLTGKLLHFTTWNDLASATANNPVVLNAPENNHDKLICYGTYFEYLEKSTKLRYRYDQTDTTSTMAYLTAITDRNSQSITLQTDTDTGRIASISDPAGRRFTLNYNGSNQCTSLQAPDGRNYTFSYIADRISYIKDPAGYSGNYSYDSAGYLTLMTTAGVQTSFTYGNRSGVTGGKFITYVTDQGGQQMHYEFMSGETGAVRIWDSRGNMSQHHSSGGKPTLTIDPTGELRQIGYENEKPVQLIDANGTTRMDYDARGNLTRVVDALHKETRMTYDASDNLLSRTDTLGNTWEYSYDGNSNLIEITDPVGTSITLGRDSRGRITTMTDQLGNTRRVSFDSWGNPSQYTDQQGYVTKFIYGGNGGMRLTRIVDSQGNYKDITYDNLDRIRKIEYKAASDNSLLGTRTLEWSALGSSRFINELDQAYSATRNVHGQIESMTNPEGAVTHYSYDSAGNRIQTTDPLGRITANEYDEASRLTKTTEPSGSVTRREYDAGGRLQRLWDPNNNLTYWNYDARGAKILERDAAGQNLRFEYDGLGRPTRRFNGRDQEIQYTYDTLGNMTRKLLYDLGLQYDYVFDAAGNLTSMSGPDGTTTYQYTARGEVSSISYPNGANMQFTYDALGNIHTLTYPDGQMVTYQYDSLNRIPVPESLRNSAGEFMGLAEPGKKPTHLIWNRGEIQIDYNALSQPITMTRENGVVTTLSYDDAGRHAAIVHAGENGTLEESALQFNLSGEMVRQSITGSALFPALTSASGSVNNLNQLNSWASQAYSYDKDGNLVSAGSRYSAVFDPENQLTSLTKSGVTTGYEYNGLGQRVSSRGTTTRNYLYDRSGRLLSITDSAGNVVHNVLYAGAAVVAYGSGAQGYYYPLFDSSGNVTALTNESGSVVTSYRYMPFGKVRSSGSSVENPFTFSGIFGVLDQGGGIYAMRKRFYDSTVGKFCQRDPLGIQGGVNLYAYSRNNPLIMADPGGENPFLIGGFILWAGSRLYNMYGTGKHVADTVNKGSETLTNAKKAADAYGRAKESADNLRRLNNQSENSLEAEIERGYQLRDANREAYNSAVDAKDRTMDTAASAAQAGYHGARAIQGLIGATAPVPEGLAGKASEMLTDASFNEVDKEVINWDTVPDPFD